MLRSGFDYVSPGSEDELTEVLREAAGDIAILGGGTMLIPEITHGKSTPATVVDLSRCGLTGCYAEGDDVIVRAMTTYSQLSRSRTAKDMAPLLTELASGITGGPQIRNRGTVGGSAAYANPSSDIPGSLVALDATLRLLSPDGVREVPAIDFYRAAFSTVRRRDEVLLELVLPSAEGRHVGYVKFKLAQSSWPIVTAATVLDAAGHLRVGVGGVCEAPFVVTPPRPDDGVEDPEWREAVRDEVAAHLADTGEAWSDVLADAAYRQRIAPAVISRSVAIALERRESQGRPSCGTST